MTVITEEALCGEWFHLEEDEPFDPLRSTVYSWPTARYARRHDRRHATKRAERSCHSTWSRPAPSSAGSITLRPPAGQEPDASTPLAGRRTRRWSFAIRSRGARRGVQAQDGATMCRRPRYVRLTVAVSDPEACLAAERQAQPAHSPTQDHAPRGVAYAMVEAV